MRRAGLHRRALAALFAVVVTSLSVAGAWTRPDAGAPIPEMGRPPLAGQFLVASPKLDGSIFAESVIYMIHHDREGAMGLIVNKVLARGSLSILARRLGLEVEPEAEGEVDLFFGGPVEPGQGFILHSTDWTDQHSVTINAQVAVTTDTRILKDMASGAGPARSIIAIGYSGWGAGQLEGELADGAWFVIPGDTEMLFDQDSDTKWQRAYDRRGIDL